MTPEEYDVVELMSEVNRLRKALDEALARSERSRGCPCLYVEPCSPHCTCASPTLSGGCARCARYGNPSQRRAAAERLAGMETQRQKAEALAAARRAALDSVQWVYDDEWGYSYCPSCGAEESGGHAEDCTIHNLLANTDAMLLLARSRADAAVVAAAGKHRALQLAKPERGDPYLTVWISEYSHAVGTLDDALAARRALDP